MDAVSRKVGEFAHAIEAGLWCDERGSLMRAFAFGILNPEGRRYELAREHLEGCAGCRSYVRSLRGLGGLLPPVALPDHGIPEASGVLDALFGRLADAKQALQGLIGGGQGSELTAGAGAATAGVGTKLAAGAATSGGAKPAAGFAAAAGAATTGAGAKLAAGFAAAAVAAVAIGVGVGALGGGDESRRPDRAAAPAQSPRQVTEPPVRRAEPTTPKRAPRRATPKPRRKERRQARNVTAVPTAAPTPRPVPAATPAPAPSVPAKPAPAPRPRSAGEAASAPTAGGGGGEFSFEG
jgi:hypothetical protein